MILLLSAIVPEARLLLRREIASPARLHLKRKPGI